MKRKRKKQNMLIMQITSILKNEEERKSPSLTNRHRTISIIFDTDNGTGQQEVSLTPAGS